MAQILAAPLPQHKNYRLGMQPQLWKCGNVSCNNLVSDVNRKTNFKKYCSIECREFVNKEKRRLKLRPCGFCSKEFIPKKKVTTRFCSPLCATRSSRGVIIHSRCTECLKQISIFGRKRFCSKRCKDLNYFKHRVEVLQNEH